MLRTSALATVAKPGRFGADKGAPGVTLSVVHPLTMAMVIARKQPITEAVGYWAAQFAGAIVAAPFAVQAQQAASASAAATRANLKPSMTIADVTYPAVEPTSAPTTGMGTTV